MTREVLNSHLKLLLVFVVAFFLLILFGPQAESADWRSDYTGRNDSSCCGDTDCWKVNARVVYDHGDTVDVEVDGLFIPNFPKKSLFPSQETQAWACHPYYGGIEFYETPKKATGEEDTDGACVKGSKDPDCYNCIFLAPGA